jgi:hypothetical protein
VSADKNKGGRPPAPPGLRRVNVPLRLPEWLVERVDEQPGTRADVIEAALLKANKLWPMCHKCHGNGLTHADFCKKRAAP